MRNVLHIFAVISLAALFSAARGVSSNKPEVLRWTEGQPGCTFSADDDGIYRYGAWTDDFGVILAVDSQELQKSLERTQPVFAILLTVRYRATASLPLRPETATLEFTQHDRAVEPALDPDELATQFQKDADAFARATDRAISRHPGTRAEQEAALQQHQEEIAKLREFLRTQSLRHLTLDTSHSEASGWIFFRARSRWVGNWKRQEQFVLRIPIGGREVEFPFALPPSPGDLLLRRRPATE